METATVHPRQAFADLITIEEHKKVARPKVCLLYTSLKLTDTESRVNGDSFLS